MKALRVFLLGIAAAVTLTSAAAAGSEAAKQRVAITANGVGNPTSFGKFVLTPLQAGPLGPDAGTETATWNQRTVVRGGLRIEIVTWVTTLKGKRGTLIIRARIEQADSGNGYHAGIGTWSVVRGTGRYARISGGGRVGNVWRGGGAWSERREGFLTIR